MPPDAADERDTPPPMPRPRRFDEGGDATRRTALASERTVLAWLRTGLTATAVALAVGKVVPDLGDDAGATWPFVALGAGYGALGALIVAYGLWRGRRVDEAIRAGRWLPADDWAMAVIGTIAIVLAVLTVVVVLVDA